MYGVGIAVVIAIVNGIFLDFFGIKYEFVRSFSGFAPIIILAVGLFWGMTKTKKEIYNNDLNFGQAIYSGLVICFFTALCLGILNFLYFKYVNKNYADEVLSIAVPQMQKELKKQDEIATQITLIKDSYLPLNQLRGTFIFILVAGIAFSAIISALIRTKDTFTEITKKKE